MKNSELKRTTPMKRTAFKPSEAKPPKGPKQRKCAICRGLFVPRSMTHKACGDECAEKHVALVKAKQLAKAQRQERAETKAKLIAMKPAKWHRANCKKAVHAYVRARDEGKECASCDRILLKLGRVGGDYDAGHFRAVGVAKNLEFDLRNIWGQCKYCNDHLRGNYQEYERRLRIKMGDAFVDELLTDNVPRHMKIHDYNELEAWAKAELKKLQKERKVP